MLCIIADDLTGALDASAAFAGRGLRTRVAVTLDGLLASLAAMPEVLAISTGSREGTAPEAAASVAKAVAALPAGVRLFKKVDSRLKGHVAAELAVLAPAAMLVAPALPEFGRVVRDGAVQGFGVAEPIRIADVLGGLMARATVPDTETVAEVDAALAGARDDTLLVGARALAEALARKMTGNAQAPLHNVRAGRVLIVVGSRDPITLPQVTSLREQARIDWLGAPSGLVPAVAHPGARLLVQAVPGATVCSGAAVSAALASGVFPALTRDRDALVLTGGATAEAVLGAMGITHLELLGEVLPGLPVARSATGQLIITKSGGFGTEQTLVQLLDMFDGSGGGRP